MTMSSVLAAYGTAVLGAAEAAGCKNFSGPMAHMINETGWFKSKLWTEAYNPAGIKAGSSWNGDTVTKTTKEYVNGTYVTVQAQFRKYSSAAEGFKAYFNLVKKTRYKAALSKTTAAEYAAALQAGGWWTSPTQTATITKIASMYKTALDPYETALNTKHPATGNTTTDTAGTADTTKKSNEEIAKEVIAGKWGNGTARKKALTEAGYSYTAVQKIVNKILKEV